MPVIDRRRLAGAVAVLAALVTVAGCDPQLAGTLTGPTTLYLEFPDAQDLVKGHTVQIGNVSVGSVRRVALVRSEGPGSAGRYAARVEISIVEDRQIPVGTTAILRRTSLLGEHFVDLVLPERGGDVGPFYADGDTFAVEDPSCNGEPRAPGGTPSCIEVLDDFEDVAANAGEVFGAVAGQDLGTIVSAAHTALNGRGQQLHDLIGELSTVVGTINDQRANLVAAIDGLGALGSALAPQSAAVGGLIDDLSATSALLAEHRERIITALGDLADLAETTNEVVLAPHLETLNQLLGDLDPVVATLANNRSRLDALISDLLRFTTLIPQAIDDHGRLNAFAYLQLEQLFGAQASSTPVPIDPTALLREGAR